MNEQEVNHIAVDIVQRESVRGSSVSSVSSVGVCECVKKEWRSGFFGV